MRPIHIPSLTPLQHTALDHLYRTTKAPRLRTRAQMVLLSVEQGLKVPQIAPIVREREATVLRWLKRYLAEGIAGLQDAPRPGRPSELTAEYRAELLAAVRRRPRSLHLPFSLWTLQRLADYLAERPGVRVSDETVRRALKHADIVLSRPQHQMSSPDPEYALKKRRLKRLATICTLGMCFTMPTNSMSAGGPPCVLCGAHGASKS
jgi:transposase